jgi:iron transport multicopper oxidase
VISVFDWYHLSAESPALWPGTTGIPLPNSTLFNGLGRYYGGPDSPLAVINVTEGLRYRFRLINMACHPNYNFSIDSHTMTIIEADGSYTEPYTVDQLQILAGQRYSFILTANQTVDNYWIRAAPNLGMNTTTTDGLNSAILRYAGAPDEEPTTTSGAFTEVFAEQNLHSLNASVPGVPGFGNADVNLQLDFAFSPPVTFYVNGTSYTNPNLPVLLQILNGDLDLMPNGSVYPLPANKVIELTMPINTTVAGGPHPFHLHGVSTSVFGLSPID